jgi:pyridoxamine 5'-phosphate oxidase
VRTVILRSVDEGQKKIVFHTDKRSPKVAELLQNAHCTALFYAPDDKVQIRLKCIGIVHLNGAMHQQVWQQARLQSKLTYSNVHAPGSILPEPNIINVNETNVPPEKLEFCASNFAVVELQIESLEMMYLHHTGNKKMIAHFTQDKTTLHWLQV